MEALEYDANDVEELLCLSDSDEAENEHLPVLFPPLVLDLEPRVKKFERLKNYGVIDSPFGSWPRNNLRSQTSDVKPEQRKSPYINVSPTKLLRKKRHPTKLPPPANPETSPTKFRFKTNAIIKHGDLKVYMCRYTTIQPLFCIPFHEHSTLQSCRKGIDDLLMVDIVDYSFVAPNGKAIAKTAEARFTAYWFYPVLTILVLSIQNTPHLSQSPDKLKDSLAALIREPEIKEKPWNLSYASFGNFSSQSLRMQSAIIRSPISSKIRKRQAQDELRLSLETSTPSTTEAFDLEPNPALNPATIKTILDRSRYDVLDRFSDLEFHKRQTRHLKLQQKTLLNAIELHQRAIQIQCWIRTIWSIREVQAKRDAHFIALHPPSPTPPSTAGRPRRYSISLNQSPLGDIPHLLQKFKGHDSGIIMLQAVHRRRLVQKSLKQSRTDSKVKHRTEMLQKTQDDFEREKALANIRKMQKLDQKQRKELSKMQDEIRRQNAVVAIQTCIRRFLAVKTVKQLRMERKAAIKIQSHLRKNNALTTLENLKLQLRKSSLNTTNFTAGASSDSYHPRLFCRRVWFNDNYSIVLVMLSKTQITLILFPTQPSTTSSTVIECSFDADELKTLGLLARSFFVTIHDIDRLVEGIVSYLIFHRGNMIINPKEAHPYRNLNIDARSLCLSDPELYYTQLYQKCSDCNSTNNLLRPLRYARPSLLYYIAKRVKLGMAHFAFFEDQGIMYVECYISRWHLCLCIGLQYREWSFINLPVLHHCTSSDKVAIAKHMVNHISIGPTHGVKIDVRLRIYHQAKRFQFESDHTTSAVCLFSVYRLGLALQLEIVTANGTILQCAVEATILLRLGYKSMYNIDQDTVHILSRQMLSYLRIINNTLILHLD
ncbi:hypothetical protein THRCLA_03787 [Thraustotheca clavata]|uniref:Uncharacterized protein n=1 Tax=Thraustotheca clavata TaxID=74557 RepID=A0A1W0A0X5_9STRA|nr:hypothetical protein THRCLA_03787 [Thraustotheca clavata]